MDNGYGGLTRQILSDPTYIVDIIKRRTPDIIEMAKHVKIRDKPWSQDDHDPMITMMIMIRDYHDDHDPMIPRENKTSINTESRANMVSTSRADRQGKCSLINRSSKYL